MALTAVSLLNDWWFSSLHMHWAWIERNAESMCLSNLGHVPSFALPGSVWGCKRGYRSCINEN